MDLATRVVFASEPHDIEKLPFKAKVIASLSVRKNATHVFQYYWTPLGLRIVSDVPSLEAP